MINSWGPEEDGGNFIWYPGPYDLDTCFSVNNSGLITFDTDAEIEEGTYNTSNSALWKKFMNNFSSEIAARYQELRSGGYFTLDNYMSYMYDKAIAKVSEMDYNKDCKTKYLDNSAYISMMHGSQESLFRYWIEQRLYFMDTYFETASDFASTATVRVSYADYLDNTIDFNISTYKPGYIKIKYTNNTGGTTKVKIPRGETVTVSGTINTATDQEILIYGGSNIKTIGRVDKYTPTNVFVSELDQLTELIVGSSDYPNANLKVLEIGSNSYLNNLQVASCQNLTSTTIDVSGCTNIETVDISNSNITQVVFSDDGGALKTFLLSDSIKVISLKNFLSLSTLTFANTSNLTSLTIENCPKILGTADDETGSIWRTMAGILNLSDANIEGYGRTDSLAFLDTYLNKSNINFSGHIIYTGTTVPDNYAYYINAYPNLEISYDYVTNASAMFQNYKNLTCIYSHTENIYDVTTGEITGTETTYYWNYSLTDDDGNEIGKYDPNQNLLYPVSEYTEQDSMVLAEEIRELLSQFSTLTDTTYMFYGVAPLTFLYDDTFDGIDLTDASTSYMFANTNLEYFTIPSTMNSIGSSCFANCYRLKVLIPETVTSIEGSSFAYSNSGGIEHPILMFMQSEAEVAANASIATGSFYDVYYDVAGYKTADVTDDSSLGTTINMTYGYSLDGETEIDRLIFRVNNSTITQFNGPTNENKSIDIATYGSESFNRLNVKMVAPGALRNCTALTEMTVPGSNQNNVSGSASTASYSSCFSFFTIYTSDLYNCFPSTLKTVRILDNATHYLNDQFFMSNSTIESISICKEITAFGSYAFASMSNNIIFTFGNLESLNTIGDSCFRSMSAVQTIDISGFTNLYDNSNQEINKGVGSYAFAECPKLYVLKFNKNIIKIPEGMCYKSFQDSSVAATFYNFSPDIIEFGERCFEDAVGVQLMVVSTTDGVTTKKMCFSENPIDSDGNSVTSVLEGLLYFTKLTNIGASAFSGIGKTDQINIGKTVAYIGSSAFADGSLMSDYTEIVWEDRDPDSEDYTTLTIGTTAFSSRKFKYTPPQSGTSITLSNIVYIPDYVTSIGNRVFSGSDTKVEALITNVSEIPSTWISGYDSNVKQIILNFSAFVYSTTEYYFLAEIPEDSGDTSYEAYLFKSSAAASGIILPSAIKYDSNVYILTEILVDAFASCAQITILALSNTTIDTVVYTSQLAAIRENAFSACTNLESIVYNYDGTDANSISGFPATLTIIEEGNGFATMPWATLSSDDVYINNYYIRCNDSTSTDIDLSSMDEITVIYDYAFNGKSNITSIELPPNLVTIGPGAFKGCTGITEIDLYPDTSSGDAVSHITSIGSEAFSSTGLLEIHYPATITFVGQDATSSTPITLYEFEEGIVLDASSTPITPTVNSTYGVDITITDLNIPASLAAYYTNNSDNTKLSKLGAIKNLFVGDNLGSVQNTYVSEGTYTVSYSPATTTSSEYSDVPAGNFTADLDLSNVIDGTFTSEDLARIVHGFGPDSEGKVPTLKLAYNDFIKLTTAQRIEVASTLIFNYVKPATTT